MSVYKVYWESINNLTLKFSLCNINYLEVKSKQICLSALKKAKNKPVKIKEVII